MRQRVNKFRDRKKFADTARSKKKINIAPTIFRGGIRL